MKLRLFVWYTSQGVSDRDTVTFVLAHNVEKARALVLKQAVDRGKEHLVDPLTEAMKATPEVHENSAAGYLDS